MIRDEVRQKLVQVLEQWIENPEGTNQLIFERQQGLIPNKGPATIITVKVQSVALQMALPAEASRIVSAAALPGGLPPVPRPNGG